MDGVQQRLHLAAVEEVVGADEEDPAVGQHLRLVVEDERVGQRADVAAVGVHDEQRPRRRIVVLLERADPRRGEHDPAVGQFGRVDVVERPVGQPLRRAAVGREAVDVEERLAVAGHRDVDPLAVERHARRADAPRAGVQQQPRLDAGPGRLQQRSSLRPTFIGAGRSCSGKARDLRGLKMVTVRLS